jgi:hypothetical protein
MMCQKGPATWPFVASIGINHRFLREALSEASTPKFSVTWPLPPKKLCDFALPVNKLYVVEEICTYFSNHVKVLDIEVSVPPQGPLPRGGEALPAHIKVAFGVGEPPRPAPVQGLPGYPPSARAARTALCTSISTRCVPSSQEISAAIRSVSSHPTRLSIPSSIWEHCSQWHTAWSWLVLVRERSTLSSASSSTRCLHTRASRACPARSQRQGDALLHRQ